MSYLRLDFETRSSVPLGGTTSVGLYNYATHPSTKVLMLAWAFGDEPVELWEPHLGLMPKRLSDALQDPDQKLVAYNCAFERHILQYVLGIILPAERWYDPQISARYLSLPANLEDVSDILGLPPTMAKDKDGTRLVKLFSSITVPKAPKKIKGQPKLPAPPPYFRDWSTDPEDWARFGEYCKRDVIAEREVARRLGLLQVFPLPERERKIWILDQKINDRGMPTDVQFVTNALALATRSKKEALQRQNDLTGLENANSNTQMLAWAQTQGYQPSSLRKGTLEGELKYNENLTPLCKKVLEARKAASSTSYKKLAAILRNVSADGRLRNQFIFMGASRTARWSGNAVQLQNLARPVEFFEDEANIDLARGMIYGMEYEKMMAEFGDKLLPDAPPDEKFGAVLLTIKSLIRTVFVAPRGKRFNVCDLAAIETCVAAWLAGCQPLLETIRAGRDSYLDFAVKMTGIPYDTLARDIKSKDPAVKAAAKRHRQVAKPGVLGCVYRLGGGQMGTDKNGDPIKQGLWGYAEAMGVEMTRGQAHEVVRVFRTAYNEIVQFWFDVEKAVKDVLQGDRTVRYMGPNSCIKIDKITIDGRHPVLRVQLPSGRYLHYMDARIENVRKPWKDEDGNDVYGPTVVYGGTDQITKQWGDVSTHGGKFFENFVQAIARDVLADKLVAFDEIGMDTVGHAHDEGIALTDDNPFEPGVEDMVHIMSQPVTWAPDLPLGADGFEGNFYRK